MTGTSLLKTLDPSINNLNPIPKQLQVRSYTAGTNSYTIGIPSLSKRYPTHNQLETYS